VNSNSTDTFEVLKPAPSYVVTDLINNIQPIHLKYCYMALRNILKGKRRKN